jgi:hypothetical protein
VILIEDNFHYRANYLRRIIYGFSLILGYLSGEFQIIKKTKEKKGIQFMNELDIAVKIRVNGVTKYITGPKGFESMR